MEVKLGALPVNCFKRSSVETLELTSYIMNEDLCVILVKIKV